MKRAKSSAGFFRCNGFSKPCRRRSAATSAPFIFRWPSPWPAALFGGLAIALRPGAKPVLMPFPHLLEDPAKRVAEEEQATHDRLAGDKDYLLGRPDDPQYARSPSSRWRWA